MMRHMNGDINACWSSGPDSRSLRLERHQDSEGDRLDRSVALRLTRPPPKISILSAVCVPRGGDTMWCHQYQSYERLSPVMKRMLEGFA